MHRILLPLCLLPLPVMAQDEEVHPYTKSNIAPVTLGVRDEAEDGCWTNAAEAPAQAKAALEAAGIAYTDDPVAAKTTLFLFVDASRDGGCYGNITIDLRGDVTWNGHDVRAVLRDAGANFKGVDSLNPVIPQVLDHFVGNQLGTFPDS